MEAYMGSSDAELARSARMSNALEIRDLQAWYGESHILHDVNLVVKPGGRDFAWSQWRRPHHHACAIMGLTGAAKARSK
jgi:branched-chain amino acid transport system ATP-binding protein